MMEVQAKDNRNVKQIDSISVNQTSEDIKESIRLIEDLKFFLATAPANWQENQVIRRYYLNHDEGFVSCIYWNNLYFITGTDIVRCIVYKFQHFGRKIIDRKKFEEGIFSDLRNLKCDVDAILEPPKSEFLEFLFKNSCLRTQKKQKVFFWFNVPHDKLMADALERDMKKEKLGQATTTYASKEPALSFVYDEDRFLFNQLAEYMEAQKTMYESPNDSTSASAISSHNIRPNDDLSLDIRADVEKVKTEIVKNEYDDDFPLDYLEKLDNFDESDDYITLDMLGKSQVPTFMEEEIEVFEPLLSSYLIPTSAASQVVHNEEYLIEQTQPIKTPLGPISMPPYQRNSYNFGKTKFTNYNDDLYSPVFPQTFSSKGQTTINRSGSPHYINDPSLVSQIIAQGSQYPDFGYHHSDYDYWQNSPIYDTVMPMASQQGYMCLNDEIISAKTPYQVVSPSMMNIVPSLSASAKSNYFKPSSRQKSVSANMMKKKFQLNQIRDRSKQLGSNKSKSERYKIHGHTLEDVVSSKSTRVMNYSKEEDETMVRNNENLVLTPESSVSHSEKGHQDITDSRNQNL